MMHMYLAIKSQYLKTQMGYRLNFFLMIFVGVLVRTMIMGAVYVIFQNMPVIAGFSQNEVYFMLSFFFISEGMGNILFEGVWHVPSFVFRGELDTLLVRPISVLFQVLSYDIGLQGIGSLALGVTTLAISASTLQWFRAWMLVPCVLFVICGLLVRLATYLFYVSHVFFWKSSAQTNLLYLANTVGGYARYPVSIYPKWLQAVLLTIFPYGFITYVPTQILRGNNALMWSFSLIVGTVLFLYIARTVFYSGLKRYESMGM